MPVSGIPEIELHHAVPTSGLRRLAARDPGFASPYWAYPWAGGLALARYLLDHPETVAGTRVLDLGAGSGLVAIAAAKAGAAQILAADLDRYAAAAIACNARHNRAQVEVLQADLTERDDFPVDTIVAGDLFYAPDVACRVTGFLDRCLATGVQVLIGDPWRKDLPVARLTELARYLVAETGTATRPSGVFRFG